MRFRIYIVLVLLAAAAAGSAATAQQTSELALDYSWVRANAPAGQCGCFNLNGGSASFAWPLGQGGFSAVGDITVAENGSIAAAGTKDALTLSVFTGGVRYRPHFTLDSLLQPFGQVLVGVAHAGGSLVQSPNPGSSNAGAAFAANLGGGLDLHLSDRIGLRLVEADYLITTFDNSTNNHQNNLRLSTGVVFHF